MDERTLREIDRLLGHAEAGPEILMTLAASPDSAAAADQAVLKNLSPVMPLNQLLLCGSDHAIALLRMLRDSESPPLFAGYSLLRGIIEAAAGAYWPLSADGQERRRRLLCWWASNINYGQNSGIAAELVSDKRSFDEDSKANGTEMKLSEARSKYRFSDLVSHASKQEGLKSYDLLLYWKLASAFAHGFTWPLAAPDLTHSESGMLRDKTLIALNSDRLVYATMLALGLLERSLNLYVAYLSSPSVFSTGTPRHEEPPAAVEH